MIIENIKNLELSLSAKENTDKLISQKECKIEDLEIQIEKYKQENI